MSSVYMPDVFVARAAHALFQPPRCVSALEPASRTGAQLQAHPRCLRAGETRKPALAPALLECEPGEQLRGLGIR